MDRASNSEFLLSKESLGMRAWSTIERVRRLNSVIQCITNFVSMGFMADILLAFGAQPSMVHSEVESPEFAKISSALVINIGTLTPSWITGMQTAIDSANILGKPWVLDPVGCNGTTHRLSTALSLLAKKPTVVRGNASEIIALAQEIPRGGGVDSADIVEDAKLSAIKLASQYNCVICVSGPIDLVTNGIEIIRIANGSPLLTKITGTGCAVTAMIAATLVSAPSSLEAAAHGLAALGVAAELALDIPNVRGPGSLQVALRDVLYSMTQEEFLSKANIYYTGAPTHDTNV